MVMTLASSILNGRITSVKALVKTKQICALSSSNYWSSTENNTNNAWNVNFNNGNFNNNNKYNNNVERAVAALEVDELAEWVSAYFLCARHKKTSPQCSTYRLYLEEDLPLLAAQVKTDTYKPTTSTCFIVRRPRIREIFAANFRDRIVQSWIIQRLEPLFEERFEEQQNVSYNCRKGYGTLKAVKRLRDEMEELTEGYTKEAYVGKFDFSGFFMSIDCNVLLSMLKWFINDKYQGNDKELLLRLTEIVVCHSPQNDCVMTGDLSLRKYLAENKTLVGKPPMVGMAIGNLTSQQFANFYLSFFDAYMLFLCKVTGARFVRFVDDFVIVADNARDVMTLFRLGVRFVDTFLHLNIHKNKMYIQPARHGIQFVGSIIMPHRVYTSRRTIGSMVDVLCKADIVCKSMKHHGITDDKVFILDRLVEGLNSYMGFLVHGNTYSLRRKIFGRYRYFWKCCYIVGKFSIVKVKRKYNLKNREYAKDSLCRRKARSNSARRLKTHSKLRCRGVYYRRNI